MASRLEWRGSKFKHQLRNATAEGIQRATVYYHAQARRTVSIPNTGTRVRVKRQTPGGNKRTRTIYNNSSKPGEAPRLRTGFGQRNILQEFSKPKIAGRVGVGKNAMYMFYLELGTRRIARRPWLMATLQRHSEIIGRLAATGGRGEIGR